MQIFRKSCQLRDALNKFRANGLTIGFIPTMGALHDGHTSLINEAKKHCDISVCSIFVNPTQFNDPADLKRYPRTIGNDLTKIEAVNCDLVFLPEVNEIYKESFDEGPEFDLGKIAEILEGKQRPGHFKGVAQVVYKLLQITNPDALFLGQKDYQQVAIIRKLVEQAEFKTSIKMCETVREIDGLAMSSRNIHLTINERLLAPHIYKALENIKHHTEKYSPGECKDFAVKYIEEKTKGKVEYLEIMDIDLVGSISDWYKHKGFVVCVAVRLGKVRLIDNLILS